MDQYRQILPVFNRSTEYEFSPLGPRVTHCVVRTFIDADSNFPVQKQMHSLHSSLNKQNYEEEVRQIPRDLINVNKV